MGKVIDKIAWKARVLQSPQAVVKFQNINCSFVHKFRKIYSQNKTDKSLPKSLSPKNNLVKNLFQKVNF